MPSSSTPHSSGKPPLRIALIEDDRIMRSLLEKLIAKQADFILAGSWSTGESALAEAGALQPDVILVDLELPGISGEDCLLALSVMLPLSALVVLTVHDDADRVFPALRAGANGYLLKGTAPSELIAGLRAAHTGGSPLSPAVANLVIRAFQKAPVKVKPPVPLPSLTPRESQILALLAKGMAPKEAAAALHLSYETVRDYLKQIYQKLHVRSRTEAVLRYLEATPEKA
jgi:DNA-binding NarL/FixJ family response regulator